MSFFAVIYLGASLGGVWETVPYTLGAYKSLSECVSAVKAELHKKAVNPDDHGACIMWVSDSQRREG